MRSDFVTPTVGLHIEIPKYKSKLIITDESFVTILSDKPMPCCWHRLWYKFLLGWTWEKIEEERK